MEFTEKHVEIKSIGFSSWTLVVLSEGGVSFLGNLLNEIPIKEGISLKSSICCGITCNITLWSTSGNKSQKQHKQQLKN